TLAHAKHVVMDKTGTLTKGVFDVQDVTIMEGFDKTTLLALVNALEGHSSHPVATAIHRYIGKAEQTPQLTDIEEVAGLGLKATVNDQQLLVGNFRLLDKFGVSYSVDPLRVAHTVIAIAYQGKLAGYFTIADELKPDAIAAVTSLKAMGITPTLLSGDRSTVVQDIARKLGVSRAYGDLLPEDKVMKVNEIKTGGERVI